MDAPTEARSRGMEETFSIEEPSAVAPSRDVEIRIGPRAVYGIIGVLGLLIIFGAGLWLGSSGIPLQSSGVPPVGTNAGALGGQAPPIGPAIPTPATSQQSRVPLPPARSVDVAPEAAAVKGDPEAPVTIVEYSDYQ